jgi:hypothetical protein
MLSSLTKKLVKLTAALLLLALFAIGIQRLLFYRFRAGDIYPAHSSYRGDPLGLKVLHDVLVETPGMTASRNLRPLSKLTPSEPLTLFYAGADFHTPTGDWDDLLRLALQGNRVVIAFSPVLSQPEKQPEKRKEKPESSSTRVKKKEKEKTKEGEEEEKEDSYSVIWSTALQRIGIEVDLEKSWERSELAAESATTDRALEPSVSWHSLAWFKVREGGGEGIAHQSLYSRDGKPVLIEVATGKGTLVLASDAYLLTNEAMREERAIQLLQALIGANRRVVFDESHHSIEETLGVAVLIRNYRLEGVLGVLLLVAALYLWKESVPLLPRCTSHSEEERAVISGRNAAQGLVNLLRRSVPPKKLLAACVEEWNKAFGQQKGAIPVPPEQDDPVGRYSTLAQTLSKKIH